MDKNAIHEQIATLAEKISFLNEKIMEEQRLHAVELDLLAGYAKELKGLTEQLKNTSTLSVISRMKEPETDLPAMKEMKVMTEPVPEVSKPQEIQLPEEIASIEDPESFLETNSMEALSVKEEKTLADEGEVPLKKKSLKQAAGKEKDRVSLNEKFKKESKALADKLQVSKKKGVKDLFDLNERYSFIENLFGGSADQFKKTMQDLSKCASRQDAELYIKSVETKFVWKDKEKFAARFTEKILALIN